MKTTTKTLLSLGAALGLAAGCVGLVGVTAASAAHPPATVVAPVAPAVHQTCTAAASLSLARTTGIGYSVSQPAPYSAGESVVVTARPVHGYVLAATPAGWTRHGAAETYVVAFGSRAHCVTPEAPFVTQAACAGGPSAAPGLLMLGTDGLDYTTSADAPYSAGQSVTVTARAAAGNHFAATAPHGWRYVDTTTETYAVSFAAC